MQIGNGGRQVPMANSNPANGAPATTPETVPHSIPLACTKRLGEFSYERSGPALIARRVIDDVAPLPHLLEQARGACRAGSRGSGTEPH